MPLPAIRRFAALLLALVLLPALAWAKVEAVADGYQVSYRLNLTKTETGNPVTDIVILETDGTRVKVSTGFGTAALGTTTISHVIDFRPTSALVMGVDHSKPGVGDGKSHAVIFQKGSFATANAGKMIGEVFPAVDERPRVGETRLVGAIVGAQRGDAESIAILTRLFTSGAEARAAFDPAGGFKAVEYSVATIVPEPGTLALLLGPLGLLGLMRRARRG